MTIHIVKFKDLKSYTGRATSTLYADVRQGRFVKPIQLGPRSAGVPIHEVETIMAARVAGVPENGLRALVHDLHEARKTGDRIEFSDWIARREGQAITDGRVTPALVHPKKLQGGKLLDSSSPEGRRLTCDEFLARKRAAKAGGGK